MVYSNPIVLTGALARSLLWVHVRGCFKRSLSLSILRVENKEQISCSSLPLPIIPPFLLSPELYPSCHARTMGWTIILAGGSSACVNLHRIITVSRSAQPNSSHLNFVFFNPHYLPCINYDYGTNLKVRCRAIVKEG